MDSIGDKDIAGFKTLRDDFTFFVTMSMMKSFAMSTDDPQNFIRSMILMWRNEQVMSLHLLTSEVEKAMFAEPAIANVLGDVIKGHNKKRRGEMIEVIRNFCAAIETSLIQSLDAESESSGGLEDSVF
jgi:hypothetical protein